MTRDERPDIHDVADLLIMLLAAWIDNLAPRVRKKNIKKRPWRIFMPLGHILWVLRDPSRNAESVYGFDYEQGGLIANARDYTIKQDLGGHCHQCKAWRRYKIIWPDTCRECRTCDTKQYRFACWTAYRWLSKEELEDRKLYKFSPYRIEQLSTLGL